MKKRLALAIIVSLLIILSLLLVWCFTEFQINIETDGNGKALPEKQTVHIFESSVIWLVPEEKEKIHEVQSVTVNGEDVTEEVRHNKIKLKYITQDQTVVVTFKEKDQSVSAVAAPVFVKKAPAFSRSFHFFYSSNSILIRCSFIPQFL